ncbi:MAG: HAD family phosphatase [Lachnospiraceae bacterium]|nr:HAD family phosphatase [Lachnospiraceae bacterium]
MTEIKNIVFDVGGVLLDYRWKQMLMDYGLTEEEAIRVGTELFDDKDHLWSEFDLANYTEKEITDKYCKKHPKDEDVIRFFFEHSEYMPVPRPHIWKQLHQIKEMGYSVYLLSNYSKELFHKHTQYTDFINEVDGMMVSYMIHQVKPYPPIYEALCEKYQLKMEQCLFFDDRKENVKAAINLGMKARVVESKEGLYEDLQSILDGKINRLL